MRSAMTRFIQWLSSFFTNLFGSAMTPLAAGPTANAPALKEATAAATIEPLVPTSAPPTTGLRISEFIATTVWD